jgi:hypothetical protein
MQHERDMVVNSEGHKDELIALIVKTLDDVNRVELDEMLTVFEHEFPMETGIVAPWTDRTLAALVEAPASPKELRDSR